MTDTTDLIGYLFAARARNARRADFVLSSEGLQSLREAPSFPRQGPQDIHVPLSSLTPAGPGARALDARFPLPVPARPQDCDCGASQIAMVAHFERCASRFPRGSAR